MFKIWRKNKPQSDREDTAELRTTELKENPLSSLIINTTTRDNRQVLRGAKIRFSEDAHFNLDLLRHLVPVPELVDATFLVGSSAAKQVVLVYLSNVANPGIVAEVKNRIKGIKTRTLFDSSYLQRNIEDSGRSPSPKSKSPPVPIVPKTLYGKVEWLLSWMEARIFC